MTESFKCTATSDGSHVRSPPDRTRPLVSVVMPAHNAARFVARAIGSVLDQTYTNWELHVVDDGSSDATAAIVAAIPDPRITLLRQDNLGVATARNSAIEKGSGEFVATLDADDLWHPRKLEKQVQCLLESSERVGFVYALSARIDEHDQVAEFSLGTESSGEVLGPLLYRNFIGNGSAPMFRRSCLEAVGGYSNHAHDVSGQGCEDWDMYLRCAEHFELRLVPEHLVGYRVAGKSMSANWEPMCRSYDRMISAFRARRTDLPEPLFHWSRSNFLMFMSSQSFRSGDYGAALRFACRAVRWDLAAAFSPQMLIRVGQCLVRSVTFRFRSDPRGSDSTDRAALGPWPMEPPSEGKLNLWTRLSPYGRIRRRRWKRLLANPVACRPPLTLPPEELVEAGTRQPVDCGTRS